MSDAELVRLALAGKDGAYEQLVRRWSPRVMAVCHARVGRADAAEDLAQETLLRALRALPTIADPAKFGPWICGIAALTCLDWLKSGRRGGVAVSSLDDDTAQVVSAPDSGDDLEKHEEIDRLMYQVERLPAPYREVLMHYYYDDCTYEELGALLDVSAATVNARLTKARQMLRERMSTFPVAPRSAPRRGAGREG